MTDRKPVSQATKLGAAGLDATALPFMAAGQFMSGALGAEMRPSLTPVYDGWVRGARPGQGLQTAGMMQRLGAAAADVGLLPARALRALGNYIDPVEVDPVQSWTPKFDAIRRMDAAAATAPASAPAPVAAVAPAAAEVPALAAAPTFDTYEPAPGFDTVRRAGQLSREQMAPAPRRTLTPQQIEAIIKMKPRPPTGQDRMADRYMQATELLAARMIDPKNPAANRAAAEFILDSLRQYRSGSLAAQQALMNRRALPDDDVAP